MMRQDEGGKRRVGENDVVDVCYGGFRAMGVFARNFHKANHFDGSRTAREMPCHSGSRAEFVGKPEQIV